MKFNIILCQLICSIALPFTAHGSLLVRKLTKVPLRCTTLRGSSTVSSPRGVGLASRKPVASLSSPRLLSTASQEKSKKPRVARYQTIFPHYNIFETSKGGTEYQSVTHLALLAKAVSTPDFDVNAIRKKIPCIPGHLKKNFMSYLLKMTCLHKPHEEKYAKLVDTLVGHSTISVPNDPLWNENRMWDGHLYCAPFPNSTPLHISCEHDLKTIVSVLLDKDNKEWVKIDATDSLQRTPLHYAQSPQVAAMLIARGANVNAQDEGGDAPLHKAHVDLIPLLIRHGARTDLKNKEWYELARRFDEDPEYKEMMDSAMKI